MDRSEFSDDWEAVRREHAADADARAEAEVGEFWGESALTVGERNR